MLKRIRCDKFREKEIIFHPGLNAVIGDEIASNSIGKSTLLMIIDFVFGGSEYIKTNSDAIEQLGPHEFLFEFDFEDEKLYFSRSTSSYLFVNAPKFAVEKVVDLAAQIKQLSDENGYFTKAQSIDDSLKAATSDLAALKELALDDICNQVNTKMYELNKKIYGDSRRAPTLNIHGDRYSFSTYGDTGTGTAFANLITFDLALLDLTRLPAVAHDLPLLKNIENPAMEKIILLYAASKKQIFIAIDKIHSYDKVASSVVETHGVIQLSKDKTLFIKNWKNATT